MTDAPDLQWRVDDDWTERVGDSRLTPDAGGGGHVKSGALSAEFSTPHDDDLEILAGVGLGAQDVLVTLSAERGDTDLGVAASLSPEQARAMAWDLLQASHIVDGGDDE